MALSDVFEMGNAGGEATFPGLSLKYLWLDLLTGYSWHSATEYEAPLSKCLSSILSKVPHLKFIVIAQETPFIFEGLMGQFPSQVKRYQSVDGSPLDALHESSEG